MAGRTNAHSHELARTHWNSLVRSSQRAPIATRPRWSVVAFSLVVGSREEPHTAAAAAAAAVPLSQALAATLCAGERKLAAPSVGRADGQAGESASERVHERESAQVGRSLSCVPGRDTPARCILASRLPAFLSTPEQTSARPRLRARRVMLCYVTRPTRPRYASARATLPLPKRKEEKKRRIDGSPARNGKHDFAACAIARDGVVNKGAMTARRGGRGHGSLLSDRSCISPKCGYIVQSLTSNVTSER